MTEQTPQSVQARRGSPFTRLHVLAVAAALVAGGFLGWLLFADHGGARHPAAVAAPKIQATRYSKLGLSVGQPNAWRGSLRRGVVKLLSSDQAASIAISAPGGAGRDGQLRRADAVALKQLFHPARVIGRRRGAIGGLPALITELVGTSPRHTKIRILTTALSSAYRTYSVQVFTALRPSPQRLLELRGALASLRFFKPTK